MKERIRGEEGGKRLTAAVLVTEIREAPNLLPRREGETEKHMKGHISNLSDSSVFALSTLSFSGS